MTEAKDLMEQAIGLEEGEQIIFPCTSKTHQNSLRVQLWRERRKLSEKGFDFDIKPSVATMEGNPVIILEKFLLRNKAIIVKKDGSMKSIRLGVKSVNSVIMNALESLPSKEEERIAQMQREDGWTDEEIEYFRDTGEEPPSVQERRECPPDLSLEE